MLDGGAYSVGKDKASHSFKANEMKFSVPGKIFHQYSLY